jgi:hypothetical protein
MQKAKPQRKVFVVSKHRTGENRFPLRAAQGKKSAGIFLAVGQGDTGVL